MILHGPSVGIGAAISAIIIVSTFFMYNIISNSQNDELHPVQLSMPNDDTTKYFFKNSSPILGNPDAKVTLLEYGDYQCFYCNKFFHDTKNKIYRNYIETGKVKMIFKDYTIIGPDSINAAHGTYCANEQGKFWQYHDILYTNWAGENNGWASSENLLKFAKDIKLDISKWTQCMKDARYQNIIVANNEDARRLGLTGTPAFFVIGPDRHVTKIAGAQPYEVFERIFESELSK